MSAQELTLEYHRHDYEEVAALATHLFTALPATYVLKVLDGAPTDVLKPDLILPCFVLRPGQYRVASKGKNL